MSNHVIINFTKAVIRVQFDMSTKESFPFAVRVAVGCECPPFEPQGGNALTHARVKGARVQSKVVPRVLSRPYIRGRVLLFRRLIWQKRMKIL